MLQLQNKPHDGGAKDGEFEMSLELFRAMVGVERMVGSWIARSQSLATAGVADGHFVRKWVDETQLLVLHARRYLSTGCLHGLLGCYGYSIGIQRFTQRSGLRGGEWSHRQSHLPRVATEHLHGPFHWYWIGR
jgi:hypothetical protein